MRKERNVIKAMFIAAAIFAAVGLICFIIKGVEYMMRDVSPKWINTVTIVGIVAFVVAVVILVGIIIFASIVDKENVNHPKKSDEELLAQYKSNKNRK